MWKRLIKEYFVFSKNERRGIVVLGVLLIAAVGMPAVMRFFVPNYTNNYEQLKLRVDSLALLVPVADRNYKTSFDRSDREAQKFYFDPNTISQDSLILLGFSPKQAASIINYRARGSFRTAEQFMRLNIVSNHQHLAGYARIAQRQPITAHSNVKTDTAAVFRSFARASFVKPVDINSADTAELKALSGIGSYLAQRIVEYRQKLGGYAHLEQLCEIKYFDRDKLLRLQSRLTVDTSVVRKIRLNDEGIEILRRHPYAGAYIARGVAQHIKFNGGKPVLISDLVRDNILTPQQAEKLRDYVIE